uniref:Unkown protein n=1 Tax=Riptortus pedestris TaxID=329032 RepID=R4WKG0_RIPPE|nr:unkown protein [Riptortus pedestris]
MTIEEGILGLEPITLVCPKCCNRVETETQPVTSQWAYVACSCAYFCCWCIPCFWWTCCLPFKMKRFKDIEHKCPRCHEFIGKYKSITVGQL